MTGGTHPTHLASHQLNFILNGMNYKIAVIHLMRLIKDKHVAGGDR